MATLQELKNLGIQDAQILIEEMLEKLEPERREIARKEIAHADYHPYTRHILMQSRKKKMEVQGNRIRRDKFKITKEEEVKENENTIQAGTTEA